jgi:hypothetical protein
MSNRKRAKLSHKRLRSMINQNQGSDSGLENSEQASKSSSDLRTEQERTALLLWVCIPPLFKLILSLIHMSRQMNTKSAMK